MCCQSRYFHAHAAVHNQTCQTTGKLSQSQVRLHAGDFKGAQAEAGLLHGTCATGSKIFVKVSFACREFEGAQAEAGLLHGTRAGEWEGSSIPSNRVWLGNISATATLRSVRSVFSKFGPLTDAAVFPARIGPLGYAFVNFEKVADAAGAYHALNNVVLPALTGCKQLKMRFKPAKVRTLFVSATVHV